MDLLGKRVLITGASRGCRGGHDRHLCSSGFRSDHPTSKGNHQMRLFSRFGAVVACVLILGLTACGGEGDKSAADIEQDLSASLQNARDDLDGETADCYAEVIIDEIGVQALKDVDLSDDDPPGDLDQDIASAALRADAECELSGSGR